MQKILFILFFFQFSLIGLCQNLTGTWVGTSGSTPYVKLVIIHQGDSCYGYTYDEGDGYCRANFAGKFERSQQKLSGKTVDFIERTQNHSLAAYILKYSRWNDKQYLRGSIKIKGILGIILPSFSSVELRKISDEVDTTKFMIAKIVNNPRYRKTLPAITKPDGPANTDTISEKQFQPVVRSDSAVDLVKEKIQRKLNIVERIYTNADSIQLFLYDNGMVDDDTVTIFLDDVIILDHYRITDKAKELTIPVDKKGKEHILALFANNLGKVPPNTAYLLVVAGKRRYELRASYDLKNNAGIIIQYKE